MTQRRRICFLLLLGSICVNTRRDPANVNLFLHKEKGLVLQKNNILILPHTDLECQKSLSPFGTDRLDSYLQMNVTDESRLLSTNKTYLTVLRSHEPLRVGDTLRMRIRLFNMDGKPVNTGGDYLRIWLKDSELKANVNGYVVDHGNGTYTAAVLLSWKGHPKVILSVANSRHHIALIMKYVEKHGLLRMMASQFIDSSGKQKEETQCSPKHDAFLKGCTLVDKCNLTVQNYGLPWFCCRPKSPFITCEDIKNVKANKTTMISNLTMRIATSLKHQRIASFQIQVDEEINYPQNLPSPSLPCHEIKPEVTWNTLTPVGYYYKNNWINRICKQKPNDFTCLQNKRIVVLGDSNNRNIYYNLRTISKSQIVTEHYTKEKPWHKLLIAKNREFNIDLMWAPHNPPFYVGPHQGLDTMRSVGNWLDRTPNDKPIIVIIHLYYHLSRTILSVFRALVRDARAGIDRLLSRAPGTLVVIIGPHSSTFRDTLEPLDYLRRCYEEIWFQEFTGIHDKVFYIDNWDRTVGNENVDIHPSETAITDVTDEILSFICR